MNSIRAMFTALLAASLLSACAAAAPCTPPDPSGQVVAQAIRSINTLRLQAGLVQLRPSAALARAAQDHACDLAAQGRISHVGSNGSRLADRLAGTGQRFGSARENVAQGPPGHDVVASWMGSRGHRANLLSGDLREIGLGAALGANGHVFWVMTATGP
ncbi:CAP domain-containing protein [Pontibaca methylaminivorans]|uniref:CAP domain-containing protein n=1 Tax=Pontibaca methylaminivorans TaxID=515897 RepID=UPI002FD881E0